MKVSTEYDLAILGGSWSSRRAALQAARQGARIALIAPSWEINNAAEYSFQAIRQCNASCLSTWRDMRAWFDALCRYRELDSAMLRVQGIDVILATSQFSVNQHLTVDERPLKATHYLLTDGYEFTATPDFKDSLQYYQLMQLDTLPTSIAIIGSGASVVEWAYALNQFTKVNVFCNSPLLLPAEDIDIQRLMEAQLRSVGVTINFVDGDLDNNQLATISETESVVLVPKSRLNHKGLSLAQLGVDPDKNIVANCYLQTQFPQLYVTGDCLGGEQRPELTQQETSVALDNALFRRRRPMHYETVSYSIQGVSPLGRWGLTENQARCRYGTRVEVFQASCLPITPSHSAQINFCKLLTLDNHLIGIHLLGEGASTLTKGFRASLTIPALAKWTVKHVQSGTVYEAIHQAIAQWENNRWQPGKWRRDWAENWFHWRRSL
ncbi:MAG: FAD-dependent oxidoreductase [Cyanobacteria bacterium P01_D01_bin.156]